MKLAFISDIHGNAIALEAVLEDLAKRRVDRIHVLGDIAYRGIEPKRSLSLIRSLDTDVIKGNADEWVVRGIKAGEVPDSVLSIMEQEREWTAAQLDREDLEYLQGLPEELALEYGKIKIHAFHATPTSLFEAVQPDDADARLSEKMMTRDADLFIYGHIHKPYIRYVNGKCIVNTGSIGLPFDGSPLASYALLEIGDSDFQTSIVRVPYAVETAVDRLHQSDYPNKDFLQRVFTTGKQ